MILYQSLLYIATAMYDTYIHMILEQIYTYTATHESYIGFILMSQISRASVVLKEQCISIEAIQVGL